MPNNRSTTPPKKTRGFSRETVRGDKRLATLITFCMRDFSRFCEYIIEAQEGVIMITRYIIGAIAGAVIGGIIGYVGKCYGST